MNGSMINAKINNMDIKDNLFNSKASKKIVSLSVYNNAQSYKNGKYIPQCYYPAKSEIK